MSDLANSPLPADAPCCAHCASIGIDPLAQPVTPRDLLAAGSGCPLSIIAYRANREAAKGHRVLVIDRGDGLAPMLDVDGEKIDPLEDYHAASCGCKGAV